MENNNLLNSNKEQENSSKLQEKNKEEKKTITSTEKEITEKEVNTSVKKEEKNTAADTILKQLQNIRKNDFKKTNDKEKIKDKPKVEEKKEEKPEVEEKKEEKSELKEKIEEKSELKEKIEKKTEVEEEKSELKDTIEEKIETVNYNNFSQKELTSQLKEIISKPFSEIKNQAEIIKNIFYKKHNEEILKQKKKFIEDGANENDFKPQENKVEIEFVKYYNEFKKLRQEFNKSEELKKENNLKEKVLIIEQIDNLINTKETLNKTFDEFKILQQKWKKIGDIPQEQTRELWKKYNLATIKFYDFVNINKELRDLDLKKNLEKKILLCEQAEKLLLEPKIIKAFNELQRLHVKWKEAGPAPREKREEIWDRFKKTTSIINKKHHEHFIEIKKEQEENLKVKTIICEKIEEIPINEIKNHKDWSNYTKEIIELQNNWKKIGFAPKSNNVKIYQQFRSACDNFFNKKREFYEVLNKELEKNLQIKNDLIIQVEAVNKSTEWKIMTNRIINIQKKWRTIGQVPRKDYLKIKKRFSEACDLFFDRKRQFFADKENFETENLQLKQELIEKIKQLKSVENKEENLVNIQKLQKEWTKIGYVHIKEKNNIYKKFQEAIDNKFNEFKITKSKQEELKLKSKIQNMVDSPQSATNLDFEIEKLKNKQAKLKDDIILWENNIGFFAKSKNAASLVSDYKTKIENAKNDEKSIQKQIIMLENVNRKKEE